MYSSNIIYFIFSILDTSRFISMLECHALAKSVETEIVILQTLDRIFYRALCSELYPLANLRRFGFVEV